MCRHCGQIYLAQIMRVIVIHFICRNPDTATCRSFLYQWFLYYSCVFTIIYLYVAQYYVNVYYIYQFTSLCYRYM